ncbi:hypothetical protein IQ255_10380 [Pleurocapsales cyanobacterium LEGE 10410]|nr:hypothetical protein [Pleurocapsales cyanobacterium LEGE 10410]
MMKSLKLLLSSYIYAATTCGFLLTATPSFASVNFETRAKTVTEHWANKKVSSDPKNKVYQAIAAYERGKTQRANSIVDELIKFNYANHRDKRVEAFMTMTMTYTISNYGDKMGSTRKNKAIKKIFTFDPDDGRSENHKYMFKSGALILGERYKGSWSTKKSAEQARKEASDYLYKEAQRFFEKGLNEHDSNNYVMHTINSWLLVHDYTKDPKMKKTAKKVLDVMFAGIAPEIIDGAWASSTRRTLTPGNFKQTDSGKNNVGFTWLAFGHNRKSTGRYEDTLFATSDYRIPSEIAALGTEKYRVSPYVHREKHLKYSPVYKYSWIDKTYGLYSTYDGNELRGGGQSHKWGVAWPGGYFNLKDTSPDQRQAQFKTGDTKYNQVFQHENALIGVTVKPSEMDRYAHNITETIKKSGWEFMKGGNSVYIAYRNIKGNKAWIVETYPASAFKTLNAFANHILKNAKVGQLSLSSSTPGLTYFTSKGDKMDMKYQKSTNKSQAFVNKTQKVNGKLRNYQQWPHMSNPWLSYNPSNGQLSINGNAPTTVATNRVSTSTINNSTTNTTTSQPSNSVAEGCQATDANITLARKKFEQQCGVKYNKSQGHDCDATAKGKVTCSTDSISVTETSTKVAEVCQATGANITLAKRKFEQQCGVKYNKSQGHDCDATANGQVICSAKELEI